MKLIKYKICTPNRKKANKLIIHKLNKSCPLILLLFYCLLRWKVIQCLNEYDTKNSSHTKLRKCNSLLIEILKYYTHCQITFEYEEKFNDFTFAFQIQHF